MARTLLKLGVQKTEHLTRLLRLASQGKGFCVAASLLAFAIIPLQAGEPDMTLAINESLENHTLESSLDLTTNTGSASLDLKPGRSATATQIGSPANFQQPESLQLVRENLHTSKPVTLRAGYGRIWDDESTLQKIAGGHQETGCAYVCANFSF